jgi:hypothetical protein
MMKCFLTFTSIAAMALINCMKSPIETEWSNEGTQSNPQPIQIGREYVGSVAENGSSYYCFEPTVTGSYTIRIDTTSEELSDIRDVTMFVAPMDTIRPFESAACGAKFSFNIGECAACPIRGELTINLTAGRKYNLKIDNEYIYYNNGSRSESWASDFTIFISKDSCGEGSPSAPVSLTPGTSYQNRVGNSKVAFYRFSAIGERHNLAIINGSINQVFSSISLDAAIGFPAADVNIDNSRIIFYQLQPNKLYFFSITADSTYEITLSNSFKAYIHLYNNTNDSMSLAYLYTGADYFHYATVQSHSVFDFSPSFIADTSGYRIGWGYSAHPGVYGENLDTTLIANKSYDLIVDSTYSYTFTMRP